jgi:hypothetical protein
VFCQVKNLYFHGPAINSGWHPQVNPDQITLLAYFQPLKP